MKKYYAILIGCFAIFVLSASIVVSASTIQASKNVTLQSVASLEKETLSFKCEMTNFNNTNKKIKSYSDKQENNFFYDTNNNMVGFILKSPIKMSIYKPLKNAGEINITNIRLALKDLIDLKSYTLVENKYSQDMNLHYITFYKYIGKYKTSDFVMLSIDENGNLISYAAPNINKFKNISIPYIDEILMEEQLKSTLNSQFGKDQYSYNISDIVLDVVDSKIKYNMYVEIQTIDGLHTADMFCIDVN